MSTDATKSAFVFPGQGAQTVGMGAGVCAQEPAARALFDRAAAILGYDLYKLCTEGPAAELDTTVHSQPALFVASLAALEQLKHTSPEEVERCAAAAGLSLGEYTALVFAGVMDFETGLRIVQERGKAMQDAANTVSTLSPATEAHVSASPAWPRRRARSGSFRLRWPARSTRR
jgi:[acyl-carrier-protein] S-malonyltransferase